MALKGFYELNFQEKTITIKNLIDAGFELVKKSDVIPIYNIRYEIYRLESIELAIFIDIYTKKKFDISKFTLITDNKPTKINIKPAGETYPQEIRDLNNIIADFVDLLKTEKNKREKIYNDNKMKTSPSINKKTPNSENENDIYISKNIISPFNNDFWKWQYSVRHFIKKYPDYDFSPIESLLEKLFDDSPEKNNSYNNLLDTIIVYHYLKHDNYEDIFSNIRVSPQKNDYICKKLKKLNHNEIAFIDDLHKKTYDYRIFVRDLTSKHEMLSPVMLN